MKFIKKIPQNTCIIFSKPQEYQDIVDNIANKGLKYPPYREDLYMVYRSGDWLHGSTIDIPHEYKVYTYTEFLKRFTNTAHQYNFTYNEILKAVIAVAEKSNIHILNKELATKHGLTNGKVVFKPAENTLGIYKHGVPFPLHQIIDHVEEFLKLVNRKTLTLEDGTVIYIRNDYIELENNQQITREELQEIIKQLDQ